MAHTAVWYARYALGSDDFAKSLSGHIARQLHDLSRAYGEGPTLPVPRVHFSDLTSERFGRIYRNSPVIIEGAIENTQAVRNWSLDDFKTRFGSTRVPCAKQYDTKSTPCEDVPLADLIDGIRNQPESPTYLMASSTLFQEHPELLKELDVFSFEKIFGKKVIRAEVFLGAAKNGSPYHCASSGNLFCNVHGEKDWLLVAPQHSLWMYPQIGKNRLAVYVNSPVLSDREDEIAEKYPLYRYVPKLQARLKPGDVLYVPPWWWHEVTNRSETIGVPLRLMDSGGGNRAFSWMQLAMVGVSPSSAALLLPVAKQLLLQKFRPARGANQFYLSDSLTRASHSSSRSYSRGWSRYPKT